MRPFKVRPIHLAYSLLGFFFAIEPLLRKGKAASSLHEGPADRGSTRLIGATFGFSIFVLLAAYPSTGSLLLPHITNLYSTAPG